MVQHVLEHFAEHDCIHRCIGVRGKRRRVVEVAARESDVPSGEHLIALWVVAGIHRKRPIAELVEETGDVPVGASHLEH